MSLKLFRIRNKKTGLFKGYGGWNLTGRIFHNLSAVKLHLRQKLPFYSKDCEIVTYELTEVKSLPIDEFATK